jgi:hypothetical protein
MALPIKPLPTDAVEVNGESVEFHALSRTDALKVSTQFADRADEAEVFMLSRATGVSEDEARAWLGTTDLTEAGKLINGIIFLSGLADPPEGNGPKD